MRAPLKLACSFRRRQFQIFEESHKINAMFLGDSHGAAWRGIKDQFQREFFLNKNQLVSIIQAAAVKPTTRAA
jgi:hypothetical protein